MSRAGAHATRAQRQADERAQRIEASSLREAALQEYNEAESMRTLAAMERCQALANDLGLRDADPFVMDRFAELYSAHQRVAIIAEGLTLNYYEASEKSRESLQIVYGFCGECGRPALSSRVRTLEDIGRFFSRPTSRDCWYCERYADKRGTIIADSEEGL